jgi:hypothetical protein
MKLAVEDDMAVTIDERGVRRTLAGGKVEQVAWEDLTAVLIMTTGDGPFSDDFFFVLIGAHGTGCLVPQGEASDLLGRLQRLPGFDSAKVIEACGCTDAARFLCWKGEAGQAMVCATVEANAESRV